MEDSEKLWTAWNLSKQYRTRPSDLYGIRDDFVAYCFDRAVHLFGSTLEFELDSVDNDHKASDNARAMRKQRILANYLGREMQFRRVDAPTFPGKGATKEVTSDQTGLVSI